MGQTVTTIIARVLGRSDNGGSRTERFLRGLDTNKNGMIDADEAADPGAKSMLERIFSRMGKEPHYPVSITELVQGYEGSGRGGPSGGGPGFGRGGPPSGGPPSVAGFSSPPGMGFGTPTSSGSSSKSGTSGFGSTAKPAATSSAVSFFRIPFPVIHGCQGCPKETCPFSHTLRCLPKGLPDWFLEKDIHHNGQITMAEYTTNWTPEKVKEFARYDLNNDGIITAEECLKVLSSR